MTGFSITGPVIFAKICIKLQLALAKRVKLVKLSSNGVNPPDRNSHQWI